MEQTTSNDIETGQMASMQSNSNSNGNGNCNSSSENKGSRILIRDLSNCIDSVLEETSTNFSREQVLDIFDTFGNAYRTFTGREHPAIAFKKLVELVDKLSVINHGGQYIDVEANQYAPMIEDYFGTFNRMSADDPTFSHFMCDGVRYIRLLALMKG